MTTLLIYLCAFMRTTCSKLTFPNEMTFGMKLTPKLYIYMSK